MWLWWNGGVDAPRAISRGGGDGDAGGWMAKTSQQREVESRAARGSLRAMRERWPEGSLAQDLEEQQQSSMRRKRMQWESMLLASWSLVLGGDGGGGSYHGGDSTAIAGSWMRRVRDAPVYFDPMSSLIGLECEKRGQHQQLLEQQPGKSRGRCAAGVQGPGRE